LNFFFPNSLPHQQTVVKPHDQLVRAEKLVRALNSFNPGSAAGPDCLTPQHIKDMAGGVSSTSFLENLQDFINLILAGGVPD